jgi:hypothetical protein
VQPERPDLRLEYTGVKAACAAGDAVADGHRFLSSCGSAEAHASAPERFPQVRELKKGRLQRQGVPLFRLLAQVRGLIFAGRVVVRGAVEPPTFRFANGVDRSLA